MVVAGAVLNPPATPTATRSWRVAAVGTTQSAAWAPALF